MPRSPRPLTKYLSDALVPARFCSQTTSAGSRERCFSKGASKNHSACCSHCCVFCSLCDGQEKKTAGRLFCRAAARGHGCRAQEPRLTHKWAIKLLSLSRLVIAELEGLILVLFLEERFNSFHKSHHFTQDTELGQVKLYKCQVSGTSNFLHLLSCSEPSSLGW